MQQNVSSDIIVFGRGYQDHEKALEDTLRRIHDSGLTINADKCEFWRQTVEFFGFTFGKDSISPDPRKVEALHSVIKPCNIAEVRSFLGMVQSSARFTKTTAQLHKLTRKDAQWEWSHHHSKAFTQVKHDFPVHQPMPTLILTRRQSSMWLQVQLAWQLSWPRMAGQ